MRAQFYFSKIDCIRPGSETTIFDFKPQPIPAEVVEVDRMSELTMAINAYVGMAQASGFCGRVYVKKVGQGRAFAGFNQMDQRGILVNKAVGEAAPDV